MEQSTGNKFAVKICQLSSKLGEKNRKVIDKELEILPKLKHKNIVKYLAHEILDDKLFIYLELLDQGSIMNIFQCMEDQIDECQLTLIKEYSYQILKGLEYIHEQQIAHCDIKAANILISSDISEQNSMVKLIDFGCSKTKLEKSQSQENKITDFVVTIPWAAPEVINQKKGYNNCKQDVWSFGCTVLEIATRKRPWYHIDSENIFPLLIVIGTSDELPIIPESLPEELRKFIIKCLTRDPLKRPSVADLLKDEFFQV